MCNITQRTRRLISARLIFPIALSLIVQQQHDRGSAPEIFRHGRFFRKFSKAPGSRRDSAFPRWLFQLRSRTGTFTSLSQPCFLDSVAFSSRIALVCAARYRRGRSAAIMIANCLLRESVRRWVAAGMFSEDDQDASDSAAAVEDSLSRWGNRVRFYGNKRESRNCGSVD